MAHLSQWCFVVARTEKGSKRHAGLSYLLVPLDQPGVEVRPIVQLTGDCGIQRGVLRRRPHRRRSGGRRARRRVARRDGHADVRARRVDAGQQIRYAREHSNLVEVAKRTGAADDPLIRERLTRSWVGPADDALVRAGDHGRRAARAGQRVEAVVGQLASRSRRDRDGRPRQGRSELADGEFDEWQQLYLFSRADTIYGGSNEIQRNIIAERVLGLPREVKG